MTGKVIVSFDTEPINNKQLYDSVKEKLRILDESQVYPDPIGGLIKVSEYSNDITSYNQLYQRLHEQLLKIGG